MHIVGRFVNAGTYTYVHIRYICMYLYLCAYRYLCRYTFVHIVGRCANALVVHWVYLPKFSMNAAKAKCDYSEIANQRRKERIR